MLLLVRLPFRTQHAHEKHIFVIAIPVGSLAETAFMHEPGFLIGAYPALVLPVDAQEDPVQVEAGKTNPQQQAHDLGPVTLVPVGFIPNENAHLGAAAALVDLEEAAVADQAP